MTPNLVEQAEEFFEETWDVLARVLPLDKDQVEPSIEHNKDSGLVVAEVELPLAYNGPAVEDNEPLPEFSDLFRVVIRYVMCFDRSNTYLTVSRSKYELRVHTSPGIRFEFERDNASAPTAHIHYSGNGGLLSPIIMRNFSHTKDARKKGDIQRLHLPVGGRRFRPSLEDFLYFVIKECGFRGRSGWENFLLERREKWLDLQLKAAVRDNPEIAAEELKRLGFEVCVPKGVDLIKKRVRGW
ncbi:hypothetical protein QP027_11125 [Corynebacterium breve]|uniref:Uncharacterized protein n=1 Tax=Corynebacterium breve TaxID=3049799 RepID=A0ABY8VD84_9CORY|nr:hypothetical protein [Corynebacterium breve]WIM67620.1 hypothetical protein QP027_11125 [Corynebacterium breve]